MTTPVEQIVATQQAHLDTALDLGNQAFSGLEKLFELNLQVARTALADGTAHAKALLAAKDVQEFIGLQSAAAQPAADKVLAYGRQVQEVVSANQSELVKVAEAQVASALSQVNSLVETAVKNAPAGSEGVVALVKSSVTAASTAIESAQKATKQAITAADTNLKAVTQSVSATAQSAPKAVKKAA